MTPMWEMLKKGITCGMRTTQALYNSRGQRLETGNMRDRVASVKLENKLADADANTYRNFRPQHGQVRRLAGTDTQPSELSLEMKRVWEANG